MKTKESLFHPKDKIFLRQSIFFAGMGLGLFLGSRLASKTTQWIGIALFGLCAIFFFVLDSKK